jgi:hypothetical protein
MHREAMGGGGLGGLGRGQYRPTGHILGGCGEVSAVKWSGVEWSGATRRVVAGAELSDGSGGSGAFQYREGPSE